MVWQDLSIQLVLDLLVIHGHCEAPKKLSTNKHYASSSGAGSTGVRPALQSLYLIHFLVKRPLATQLQVAMETQDSVGWGFGVGEQHRRPLAAHSMIINDHPAGLKSGPGEKQTQSSVSETKCHRGKTTKKPSQEWRRGMRCFLLWLENGDDLESYNVAHNGGKWWMWKWWTLRMDGRDSTEGNNSFHLHKRPSTHMHVPCYSTTE